jgi:hypothetical protein
MTRVTLAELKNAMRNRALRRALGQRFPTPMPMATSAVRRFHREGAQVALDRLNRGLNGSNYWGPNGSPQARAWAESIRTCFDRYVALAAADPRPTLNIPFTADVAVGQNLVGVSLDVILLDPAGYVGRYVLWDLPALTQSDAELLSAPIVRALEDELGEDRVSGVEVWHLRSGSQAYVDAATALARLPEVGAVVEGYSS